MSTLKTTEINVDKKRLANALGMKSVPDEYLDSYMERIWARIVCDSNNNDGNPKTAKDNGMWWMKKFYNIAFEDGQKEQRKQTEAQLKSLLSLDK